MHDEVIFHVVAPGDSIRLITVYQRAVAGAEALLTVLAGAGLHDDMLLVVPTLSEVGAPVVHVSLTAAGA